MPLISAVILTTSAIWMSATALAFLWTAPESFNWLRTAGVTSSDTMFHPWTLHVPLSVLSVFLIKAGICSEQ